MAHRVFVGLSGGVDSAVSAALLKKRGLDVCGVFIKIWQPEFIECTWKEDRLDAMRVCAALSIPFREVDFSAEYKREVVDTMMLDYAAGITPNPDILCNRSIKFGAFTKWAKSEGADMVATGHYAEIAQQGAHFELRRGVDKSKDQSYFLHQLGQSDLARTLFPVGGLHKSDVRAKAQQFDLPVSKKPDSQGLCFVGDVSMRDFLRRFIKVERGRVLSLAGEEIGEHEGAALYTVGERHGFTIVQKGKTHTPHYVVRIDTEQNTITVSPSRADAEVRTALLRDVRWVHKAPEDGVALQAQARYREDPFAANVRRVQDEWLVESFEPHVFPPGQSLVLYRRDVCVGGGIIRKHQRLHEPRARPTFSPESAVKKILRRVQ